MWIDLKEQNVVDVIEYREYMEINFSSSIDFFRQEPNLKLFLCITLMENFQNVLYWGTLISPAKTVG